MADITNTDDIAVDLSPFIRVYKDGRVERIYGHPHVPPSPEDSATGVSSKDITVSPNISVRVYLPKLATATQKLPVLVYYHGGGFCLESAFSSLYHRHLNILVSQANAIAISVEYRLAPEHPLPAGYEDCWEALQWVASHATNEGQHFPIKEPWLVNHGDFERIFVGGDSAGGNIVHNVAIRAGKEPLNQNSKLLGGILSFPYFWSSNEKGEKDELREISLRYVEAVKKSGWKGEIEVVDVEGEDHCFPILNPDTEKAKDIIKRIASFIQD
nr:2-hydroxyisoflavanone dehydratase-like [Ipomoea batatas]